MAKVGEGAGCAGAGTTFLQQMQNTIHRDDLPSDASHWHVPPGGMGRSKSGLFIEMFPSDVIAFPSAIKTAHDQWKR